MLWYYSSEQSVEENQLATWGSCSRGVLVDRMGRYVYALIDPRKNEIFYIGFGIGNRIFACVA